MTDIKIEKNVPLRSCGPWTKYPFGKMEIGDSFEVPENLVPKRATGAAYAWGKANGKKFTYRTTGGRIRIWRVS